MLTRSFPFALCLAGLLAACDGASVPAPAPAPPAAAASPAASSEEVGTTPAESRAAALSRVPGTCPDPDFDAFLARFESSAQVQRSAAADPLTVTRIDPDAQPEPAPVTEKVPVSKMKFPVLADAATRRAEGTELRIESRGENARDVTVARPDSGAQVHLEFEMRDCWTLVRVDDESM